MPPKNNTNELQKNDSNMTDIHHQHSTTTFYHQQQQNTQCLSDLSVDEILVKYQDNSQLLNHILLAKAEEDKRRTAEELRQAEEARLQTKYIELELTTRQDDDSFGGQPSTSTFNKSDTTNPFIDQHDEFLPTQQGERMYHSNFSPVAMTMSTEFHQYNNIQQPENVSIASSSSPSIDFNFDFFGGGGGMTSDHMTLSPPHMTTAEDFDLPLFPPDTSHTTYPTAPTAPIAPTTVTINKKAGRKRGSPPRSALSSYESIMELNDVNMKSQQTSPPPPIPPLDHEKVMEALRAKLRKCPYHNVTRPLKSPEPTPIIPNTYPTTGVLLLNLKSRRRRPSSVIRRTGASSTSKQP